MILGRLCRYTEPSRWGYHKGFYHKTLYQNGKQISTIKRLYSIKYFLSKNYVDTSHLQGPLACDMYKISCKRKTCFLEYSGEKDSVFFLSNLTAAGDEMGWDFVSAVKTTKTSFTSFCNEMTRKYRTTIHLQHHS